MGKIRTKTLGMEDVEKAQKEEAKKRSEEKKLAGLAKAATMAKESKKDEVTSDLKDKDKKTETKKKPSKKDSEKTVVVHTRGKKYKEVKKLVDKTKAYKIEDAVALLKKLKTAKFDESVELHINVTELGLKGEVDLPHSIGKVVRVAVVSDELLEKIANGKIEFDVLVAHPSFMPKLAKYAKLLGPKGLMPNPKAGTVSPNPEEVVKKFSKGLLRWKTEPKFPLVHQMIGKISQEDKMLIENALKFISVIGTAHILKAYLKSTMSPSIRLEIVKE
ncbi:MAG: hypothetical protein Q7R95_03225 [bacterium]|nr:hypothetical protein [bacterium]